MKKLILFLLVSTSLVACKKDRPEIKSAEVLYLVECSDCTIYLDGNQPGPVGDPSKAISVTGVWSKSQIGTAGKIAQIHVYVNSNQALQTVKASIKSGDKEVSMNEQLGAGKAYNKLISLGL